VDFHFFCYRLALGNFKTDQNIHPQDFNVTPSSSNKQQNLCHELYNDILLSHHLLLMVFKKLSDLLPDIDPKLKLDCCIYCS